MISLTSNLPNTILLFFLTVVHAVPICFQRIAIEMQVVIWIFIRRIKLVRVMIPLGITSIYDCT